jgi:hypothetical protein
VNAAAEGDLDEAVLRSVARHAGISLGSVYGRKGKPHLLRSLAGFNNAAKFAPWIVVVDLDRDCDCAPPCVKKWLPAPSPRMCFRIAVRAIEAWLLADRERMAEWIGVKISQVPQNPEELADPKRELINLAKRSHRLSIKRELLPAANSDRTVGPLYTTRMIEFVENNTSGWRPPEAAKGSDSLARCLKRMSQLTM